MDKKLNVSLIEEKLEELGMNQSGLGKKVGKTRAAVSKWMRGESFPRPPELLKLGKILSLKYRELVQILAEKPEPLVAFRKRKACKTTEEHVARAKEMGRFLEPLVPYLSFDQFVGPARLKSPVKDYEYLQSLVSKLRREMKLSDDEPIKFSNLMAKFREHQAVVIPTLWGKKNRHENALHIYLPATETTWVYLNLDSEQHDFKFWMAHEYGHVLSADLLESEKLDEAEDFADAFAGALLFPESAAKRTFRSYLAARSDQRRLKVLVKKAGEFGISPYSVYMELQHYAEHHGEHFVEVALTLLHSCIANFNKKHPTLSEQLFDNELPSADHFMRVVQEQFGTHFYKALGEYLRETQASPSAIGRIMDVSLMDARAFHSALATV